MTQIVHANTEGPIEVVVVQDECGRQIELSTLNFEDTVYLTTKSEALALIADLQAAAELLP